MKLEKLKPRPNPLLDALDCSRSAWRPAFLDFARFLLLPLAVGFCTGSWMGWAVERVFVSGTNTWAFVTMRARVLRRDIARIQTVLTEQRRAAQAKG